MRHDGASETQASACRNFPSVESCCGCPARRGEAMEMKEDQESITRWERETFGEIRRDAREAKLTDEMAELTKALWDGDERSVGDEIASDHGIDVQKAVDAKMARNRQRKWRRTAAGNFQHVEDEQ